MKATYRLIYKKDGERRIRDFVVPAVKSHKGIDLTPEEKGRMNVVLKKMLEQGGDFLGSVLKKGE